jgi:signal peptidase I
MSRRIAYGIAALGVMLAAAVLEYALFVGWDARTGQPFKNVSRSMEPALLAGDWVTILPIAVPAGVARGDIVAHAFPPDRSKQFVKRIVGLPGDTLSMAHGILSINGQILREPYASIEDTTSDPVSDDFHWHRAYLVGSAARDTAAYVASRDNWGPIVIPSTMYFVLGDNRDNSLDSRYWGFLPAADIFGKVRRVYFSRDSTGHIRLGRFGRRPR